MTSVANQTTAQALEAPEKPPGPGAVRRTLDRLTAADRTALGIWALTRLSVIMVAGAVGWLFAAGGQVAPFFDRFVQWDVHHFWGIAMFGYGGQPTGVPNEAFFPGLPALMWLGSAVSPLSPTTAGLLISLVASAIATVALSRLADLEYGPGTGVRAVLFWLLAPPAIFLATAYTESLFLAMAIPAWLAARRGRWPIAGALAAGAMTVRVSGVFLAAALIVEFLTSPHRRWRDLPWLALPGVVLLGWMFYLHTETGDWLAWLHAQQQGWNRSLTLPWASLQNTWDTAFGGRYSAEWTWMFRAELVAMAVGVALTLWLLYRRRWGEATWIGLQVGAFSTSYWFFSVPRSTLLWWPLWIALAAAATRRRWLLWLYLAVSGPLAVVWAGVYLTGRWAG